MKHTKNLTLLNGNSKKNFFHMTWRWGQNQQKYEILYDSHMDKLPYSISNLIHSMEEH